MRQIEAAGTLPCNPASHLDEVERACDPEGRWVGASQHPSREDRRTHSGIYKHLPNLDAVTISSMCDLRMRLL